MEATTAVAISLGVRPYSPTRLALPIRKNPLSPIRSSGPKSRRRTIVPYLDPASLSTTMGLSPSRLPPRRADQFDEFDIGADGAADRLVQTKDDARDGRRETIR